MARLRPFRPLSGLQGAIIAALAVLSALLIPGSASARVHQVADGGFVVREMAEVPVSPEEVWKVLIQPTQWWSPAHSYSGDSANFTLLPRAGGCFCETLPDPDTPDNPPRGSVEHMRVIHAEEGRALRMTGALGPLQSEAVVGTLTIFLKADGARTQILWEYVVGGFLRTDARETANRVDAVLAEQILRLAGQFGGSQPAPRSAPAGPSGPAPSAPSAPSESVLDWDFGDVTEEPQAPEEAELPPAPPADEEASPLPEPEPPVFIGR